MATWSSLVGVAGTSVGVASVVSLHRYPVKSMLGERMSDLAIDERGIVADRRWSVRTKRGKIGSGKTTRRFAAVQGLQQVRAHVGESGVFVTLPDGTRHHIESAVLQTRLSELVGESVTLAPESDVSHFDDGSVCLIARASVEALGESRGARRRIQIPPEHGPRRPGRLPRGAVDPAAAAHRLRHIISRDAVSSLRDDRARDHSPGLQTLLERRCRTCALRSAGLPPSRPGSCRP